MKKQEILYMMINKFYFQFNSKNEMTQTTVLVLLFQKKINFQKVVQTLISF